MRNGKEVWWREYRRRQCRQRKKVNLEVAIRCIFKRCLGEYTKHCSIEGVQQMTDPKNSCKERIARILLFGGMCSIFFYFFWYLWFDHLSKPLVVSMQTATYPISELDFPAIAICNVNRISKRALYKHEENALKRKVGEITQTITWQLGGFLDFSYNESIIGYYVESFNKHSHDYAEKVIPTMKQLAPSCDEMLISCMWAGERVDCKKLFNVRRTFRGHCCTFNYVTDYDTSGIPSSTRSTTKRQLMPGTFHGLNVLLDPLLEDYAYTTHNIPGVEILIFDSTHYADPHAGRLIQRFAEPNRPMYLQLRSVKQIASKEVRNYAPNTRKCLFQDEMKEKFYSLYSYNACIVNCRTRTIQALCKCTPYYLPTSNIPTCTLEQLPCLNKYREKFLFSRPIGAKHTDGLEIEFTDSLYCPECLPDCEFTKHKTKAFKVDVDPNQQFPFRKFNSHENITNKCFVSIYQSTPHGTLDRLDVVSNWYELVSDVGSVGGILIALSVFSFMEFIYFFIVKFIIEMCNLVLNKI